MTSNSPGLETLIEQLVAHYQRTRRTFTEDQACSPIWAERYSWGLALDWDDQRRFVQARDGDDNGPSEWFLSTQTLANSLLLQQLHVEQWDGHDLDAQLQRLDEQTPGTHHVFCERDPRFELIGTRWQVAEEAPVVQLPAAVRTTLDALAPAVFAAWRAEPVPQTLQQLTQAWEIAGFHETSPQQRRLWVRSWLENQPLVSRVSFDLWILAEALPELPRRSRLQVLPQRDAKPNPGVGVESSPGTLPFDSTPPTGVEAATGSLAHPVSLSQLVVLPAELPVPALAMPQVSAHWKVILRTIHTLEGFLPVDKSARSVYPLATRGENALSVFRGQWYATGEMLWLWLDRENHRLFGPDLKAHLEWCEVGMRLQLDWRSSLLVIRDAGFDDDVAREEVRLANLEELARLRAGRGESYRSSLATLLQYAGRGLDLREIVEKVSNRQGHQVHVGTIRAILRAGGFAVHEGRWYLPHPDQSAANLRSSLANALLQTSPQPQEDEIFPELTIRNKLEAINGRLKKLKEVNILPT